MLRSAANRIKDDIDVSLEDGNRPQMTSDDLEPHDDYEEDVTSYTEWGVNQEEEEDGRDIEVQTCEPHTCPFNNPITASFSDRYDSADYERYAATEFLRLNNLFAPNIKATPEQNAFSIYGCDKLLKNSIRKIRFSLYTPFLCILLAHGFLKFVKTFYHQDLLNAVQ